MAVVDKDLTSRLASVERAIALPNSGLFARVKTKFFKSSPAEDLMQFLLLHRPAEEAQEVVDSYERFKRKRPIASSQEKIDEFEIDEFVRIFKDVVAPKIFSIPVPEKLPSENDEQYRKRVKELYTDPAFGLDYNLQCMRQFKNLFARATAQLQGKEYDYRIIGGGVHRDGILNGLFNGLKQVITSSDNIWLPYRALIKANSGEKQLAIYTFEDTVRVPVGATEGRTESAKQAFVEAKNKRRITKNILLGFLTAVAIFIGIGEAGGPFKFALAAATAMGMGAPVIFAVFVAFAAFTVNALLFRADSFASFRDLFLKNRFTKDANGRKLSKKAILFNALLVFLAAFAGFVIAVLSFNFSPLFGLFAIIPVISAYPAIATGVVLFISAMTFIGFTGVLSYALMSKYSLQSVKKFGSYLRGLFIKPMADLITAIKEKQAKAAIRNLALLILNTVAIVTAAGVLGISVVAATSGMFYSAMLNVLAAGPGFAVIAAALGTTGVAGIIGVAEIALGTFFVINVFKVINFSRNLLARGLGFEVDKPVDPNVAALLVTPRETRRSRAEFVAESSKFKGTALYVLDCARYVVVGDGSFRSFAVRCGAVLGVTLCVFAGLNAWAFGAGYATTLITHVFVANTFNFITLGAFATMFIGAARYLAQVGYMVASFGGNASAALQAVLAPEKMTVYGLPARPEWLGGSLFSDSPSPLSPPGAAAMALLLDSPQNKGEAPSSSAGEGVVSGVAAASPARSSSSGQVRTSPPRMGSLAMRAGLGR